MSKDKQTYKIHRWDSVLFGRNTDPRPILYVEPDKILLRFAQENNNVLMVNIYGSESGYDGKNIPGIFMKSSDVPNYRPNFFKQTGLYVIALISDWYGYPDCMGECQIFGLTRNVPVNKEIQNNPIHAVTPSNRQTVENYRPRSFGMDSYRIIVVSMGLIVILLSVLFICK